MRLSRYMSPYKVTATGAKKVRIWFDLKSRELRIVFGGSRRHVEDVFFGACVDLVQVKQPTCPAPQVIKRIYYYSVASRITA